MTLSWEVVKTGRLSVPRRRVELDRDEKTREILDATAARLRADGYDGLSVAALARELGVATNSVYWYFPSKDQLVVAAVEEMLQDIVGRKPPASRGVEQQVLWFVDQLAELADLRAALAQRAHAAPVVADFIADTNTRLRRMLANALKPRVPRHDLDNATDAILAAVQGLQAAALPRSRQHQVLRYALRKLTSSPSR
jgi:AcrR family transcriptional regulator